MNTKHLVYEMWKAGNAEAIAKLFEDAFRKCPSDARVFLGGLLQLVIADDRANAKARQELAGDGARIALMGQILHKSGLRSYTDERGRIYIAARKPRPIKRAVPR